MMQENKDETAARPAIERIDILGSMALELAHEFNNLMTIVLGSLDQLRRQELDARGTAQLERAKWGATSAARLTQQMLALPGRDAPARQVIDVNETIRGFDRMLELVGGRDVTVRTELSSLPLPVRMDALDLQLALLNLVRNAVDAMDGSGEIVLKTVFHQIDGLGLRATAEIAVSDTGRGMSPDVVAQASEPFYTTKPPGKGTGLGLPMVQRFVQSCGGKVTIESIPGLGTTVKLALPRASDMD